MKTTYPITSTRIRSTNLRIKALLLATVLLFTFGMLACTDAPDSSGAEFQQITVVISNGEATLSYSVHTAELEGEKKSVFDILRHLEEREHIELEYQDSGYGAYLTKIGHITQDSGKGVYIGVWTSYEKDFDVSQYATSIEYGGKTLTSSGVGISYMGYEDGTVIYIGEIVY